jgi:hypothetical protein
MWNYVPKHRDGGIFDGLTFKQIAQIALEGSLIGAVVFVVLVMTL